MLATTEVETLSAFSMFLAASETKVNAVHFIPRFYIILQCLQQKLLRCENRKCQYPSFSPDTGASNPQNGICISGSVYTGSCMPTNEFRNGIFSPCGLICYIHKNIYGA